MLKKVLCEGAFFSEGYRAAFEEMRRETGGDPEKARAWVTAGPGGWVTPPSPRCRPPEGFTGWMAASLSDAGYFSALDGCKRIAVASHTYDLGEYLGDLDGAGRGPLRLLWHGGDHGVQAEVPRDLPDDGQPPHAADQGEGSRETGRRLPELPAPVQPGASGQGGSPGGDPHGSLRRSPRLTAGRRHSLP